MLLRDKVGVRPFRGGSDTRIVVTPLAPPHRRILVEPLELRRLLLRRAIVDIVLIPMAKRSLTVETDDRSFEAMALIGLPRRKFLSGGWSCAYQVRGLGNDAVGHAEAIDSAHALYLALQAIGARLGEARLRLNARLRWTEGCAWDFPPGIVPVACS